MPQSSSSYDRRRLIVWAILVVVIGGGFYLSNQRDTKITHDVAERSIDLNEFLRLQCSRDDYRDLVIIGALQDAKRRAQASIEDPFKRQFEVTRIQLSIDQIKSQRGDCLDTLPPVTQ